MLHSVPMQGPLVLNFSSTYLFFVSIIAQPSLCLAQSNRSLNSQLLILPRSQTQQSAQPANMKPSFSLAALLLALCGLSIASTWMPTSSSEDSYYGHVSYFL